MNTIIWIIFALASSDISLQLGSFLMPSLLPFFSSSSDFLTFGLMIELSSTKIYTVLSYLIMYELHYILHFLHYVQVSIHDYSPPCIFTTTP